MKIGVFDLNNFFWTLAGARPKDEPADGLALDVLRYLRRQADALGVEAVVFASDGPPELPSRSWRKRVNPGYKGDRKPKDEAQRAELVALVGALESAGFLVCAAAENETAPAPPERLWFEADDVAASFALRLCAAGHEALVVSNDWDLAQVLATPPGVEPATLRIRLFTTRGEERTAADVQREYGVTPEKLAELKALAGDSDGYKPFPGEAPGKPGIGEKGARDILVAFGSAHSAMAAALSNLDDAFKTKGLPPRIPRLLRAGGEEALKRGLACAKLRWDVSVPDDFDVGDWDEVEGQLLDRKLRQVEELGGAPPNIDVRSSVSEDVMPPIGKLLDGDRVREIVEEGAVEHEALPPKEQAVAERKADRVCAALESHDRTVILTETEFMALAPLPALRAAGVFEMPEDMPEIGALIFALEAGELRPIAGRQAFAGTVAEEVERALISLGTLARQARDGVGISKVVQSVPGLCELANYGRPLTRVR